MINTQQEILDLRSFYRQTQKKTTIKAIWKQTLTVEQHPFIYEVQTMVAIW